MSLHPPVKSACQLCALFLSLDDEAIPPKSEIRCRDFRMEPFLKVYNTPEFEVIRPSGEWMARSSAGRAGGQCRT